MEKREILINKEILATIDPMIRRLVVKINQLSFVKKTDYSCSGNYEFGNLEGIPYVSIIYYTDTNNQRIVNKFNKEILEHPNIILKMYKSYGFFRKTLEVATYWFLSPEKKRLNKNQAIQTWQYFYGIVEKYLKDYSK